MYKDTYAYKCTYLYAMYIFMFLNIYLTHLIGIVKKIDTEMFYPLYHSPMR